MGARALENTEVALRWAFRDWFRGLDAATVTSSTSRILRLSRPLSVLGIRSRGVPGPNPEAAEFHPGQSSGR